MLQKCFPTFITWKEADQSFLSFEAVLSSLFFFNPTFPYTNARTHFTYMDRLLPTTAQTTTPWYELCELLSLQT